MIAKKRKDVGLTDDQREHLLRGSNLLNTDFPFRSDQHRRELYELHKAELLKTIGRDRRPHCWWQYSAPEKRRQVIAGDESKCLWDRGLHFGKARFWDVADGLKHNEDPGRPIWETQKQYLQRHGLYQEEK